MAHRFLLPLTLAVLAIVAGCNRNSTSEKTSNNPPESSPQVPTPAVSSKTSQGTATTAGPLPVNSMVDHALPSAAVTRFSDSQIARITSDANTAEIQQGQLAQGKAKDARVKEFAERMVKHHTQAKDKQAKLKLDLAASDMAIMLQHDAENTMSQLKSAPDSSFDAAYMAAQVNEHQQVLDTIDRHLLPSTKNDELTVFLKEMRATVELHLKDARDIQSKIAQAPASP